MKATKVSHQAESGGSVRISQATSQSIVKGVGSRKKYLPYLIVLPALVLTLPVLVPFFQSIYYSMTTYSLTNPIKNFIWFENYIWLFTDPDFWNSVRVSFVYAGSAVGIELLLGLLIAVLLNQETLLAKIFRPLLLMPLMIAPIIGTLMWKLMMSPEFGVLNYFLSFFGARDFQWASAADTAMFSVVLIDVWMFTPFIALLLLAGLRSMPAPPFEAAMVDGASKWFIFKNLTLPMLMPFIIVSVVFRLIDSLRQFDIIFGLTKGGPGSTLMNFQVSAYTTAFTYTKIADGSAMMFINWLIVYIISMFLVKFWRKSQDRLSLDGGFFNMAASNSNSRKRKVFFQKLVVNILLLVCFAFLLFPVFWVTTMAFKSHDDILTWPPKFVFKPTLENFQNITTAVRTYRVGAVSSDFLKGFGNSLIVTTSALLLSLLTGIPAAYALGRFRFKGKNDIAFTFLTFRFAPELLVIIPIYLIFQKIGLYDTYFGLVWVYQLITMPMVIWILMSYFEDVSVELEQASLVDGFSLFHTFRRIILPLAKPGIAAASLLAFIYAWNNFIFALILGSSKVQPVTVSALKFITAEKLRYGDIAAACLVAAIPILILAIYAQRYMVRGLSLGAVKK